MAATTSFIMAEEIHTNCQRGEKVPEQRNGKTVCSESLLVAYENHSSNLFQSQFVTWCSASNLCLYQFVLPC